jgi:hypothetical protein
MTQFVVPQRGRLHGRPDKSELGAEGVNGWRHAITPLPRSEGNVARRASVLEHSFGRISCCKWLRYWDQR